MQSFESVHDWFRIGLCAHKNARVNERSFSCRLHRLLATHRDGAICDVLHRKNACDVIIADSLRHTGYSIQGCDAFTSSGVATNQLNKRLPTFQNCDDVETFYARLYSCSVRVRHCFTSCFERRIWTSRSSKTNQHVRQVQTVQRLSLWRWQLSICQRYRLWKRSAFLICIK